MFEGMAEVFPNLESVFQVHFVERIDFSQVPLCLMLGRKYRLSHVTEE